MFRKMTAVTTALAISIMLAACGGDKDPARTEPPGARAAPAAEAGADTNARTPGQGEIPAPTRPQRLNISPTEEPSGTGRAARDPDRARGKPRGRAAGKPQNREGTGRRGIRTGHRRTGHRRGIRTGHRRTRPHRGAHPAQGRDEDAEGPVRRHVPGGPDTREPRDQR